jgi:hypothetical protein
MALKPCRECSQQVSTEAANCPRCGVPQPTKSAFDAQPQSVRSTATPKRKASLWPLGLFILGIVLAIIGTGLYFPPTPPSSSTTSSTPSAPTIGRTYRVKRKMPACPSAENLTRIMRLVAAKDYQATSLYIVREGCVVLQEGWEVAYDGYGGFGVAKIRRPGNPDVYFTPKESIE